MSQPGQSLDDPAAPVSAPGYTGHVLWLLVMAAAVVVYHVTGNPLYAVTIPYFHAGSKSFCCGLWLWYSDANLPRGRTHLCFHLAFAFWLASASAFLTLLVFAIMDKYLGRAPAMNQLEPTFLTLFGGVCIGSMTGIFATFVALRYQVKIWVHPHLRQKCGGRFEHLPQAGVEHNYAFWVITLSHASFILLVGTVLLMWNAAADAPNDVSTFSLVIEILFLLVGPWLMIGISLFASSRIVASSLDECWG